MDDIILKRTEDGLIEVVDGGAGKWHAQNFWRELKARSINKENPIPEWRIIGIHELGYGDHEQFCICEKNIRVIYFIENKITKEVCKIGKDCAQKWLKPKLECECGKSLGAVCDRWRNNDFLCKKCKNAKEKATKMRIEKLGNYIWNGQTKFKDLPLEFLTYIINSDDETPSVLALKEYINLAYLIEDA